MYKSIHGGGHSKRVCVRVRVQVAFTVREGAQGPEHVEEGVALVHDLQAVGAGKQIDSQLRSSDIQIFQGTQFLTAAQDGEMLDGSSDDDDDDDEDGDGE